MKPPRGLTPEEAALWAKVAQTVTPLEGRRTSGGAKEIAAPAPGGSGPPVRKPKGRSPQPPRTPPPPSLAPGPSRLGEEGRGLDSSWDKKLTRGVLEPDFTLDLHGHSLNAAHARLLRGLSQAKAMGARVVLVITGKPRPADAAARGTQRGAIRAKLIDWLAASEHAQDIAAIRNAHRRHGGSGALYVVLRKRR